MVEYNKLITRDFSPEVSVVAWESDGLDLSWVEEKFGDLEKEDIEDIKSSLIQECWENQRQLLSGNNSLDKQLFGSSETGAICGVNKYEGKFTFFQIKVGKVVGFEGTIGTDTGNLLEPKIAKFFKYYQHGEDINTQKRAIKQRMKSREKIREVYKANFFLTNSNYPNLFSSIDFILPKEFNCPIDGSPLETDSIIEIKNVGFNTYQEWKREGFISVYYFAQICQQMLVSGLKHAYLLAFVENQYLVLYKITPTQDWFDLIVNSADDMSYRILAYRNISEVLKTLPEGSDDYVQLIAQRDSLEPEVTAYDDPSVIKSAYKEDDSVMVGTEEDLTNILNYLNEHEAETSAKEGKVLTRNLLLQSMKGVTKMEVVSDGFLYTVNGGKRWGVTKKEIKG